MQVLVVTSTFGRFGRFGVRTLHFKLQQISSVRLRGLCSSAHTGTHFVQMSVRVFVLVLEYVLLCTGICSGWDYFIKVLICSGREDVCSVFSSLLFNIRLPTLELLRSDSTCSWVETWECRCIAMDFTCIHSVPMFLLHLSTSLSSPSRWRPPPPKQLQLPVRRKCAGRRAPTAHCGTWCWMLRRAASAAANKASTATAVCAPEGTTSRQERYISYRVQYISVYSSSSQFLSYWGIHTTLPSYNLCILNRWSVQRAGRRWNLMSVRLVQPPKTRLMNHRV